MNYGGFFDIEPKINRVNELEGIINSPNFWSNESNNKIIIQEYNELKKTIEELTNIKETITTNIELIELLKENEDKEIKDSLNESSKVLDKKINDLEIQLLLNGPYDNYNAIFEIHSGAGGTEANDWASMLYRMYLRYFERKNYKVEVLYEQKGDEVGFKTISMLVKGDNAYGYLVNEVGVHRLVRISPFDSNAKRHTSFASVDVAPYFNQNINVEIKESDLSIDAYKSSGAGGQSVNTTDSAVRITHIPTGIVVTCQNERSQIQNREKALEILKNKLYKIELEKQEEQLREIKGGPVDINFGSQIRSYVLHPYAMVKDHRNNLDVSNVNKILDGHLDIFINANLKNKRNTKEV